MLYNYTAVISESNGKFYAKVPDITACITTGNTFDEVVNLITDALNGCLTVLEDQGIIPSAPTPQSQISHDVDDILTVIHADTLRYRAETDTRAVRKNVSLPAWMAALADKKGINCSKVLQDALMKAFS